jgi:hypothetical protein
MSATVRFEDRAAGRTDALLGVITIGIIVPIDHPRLRVAWQCFLPEIAAGPRPVADTEAAKRAIERRAAQWLEAAGLS